MARRSCSAGWQPRQIVPVATGESHVVVDWRLAKDSRKLIAGSALLTAIGQPAGSRPQHLGSV